MLSSIAAVGGALSPMRIPKPNNNNRDRVSSTSKLTKKSTSNNNKTKVAVRIRPLNKREQSMSSVVWSINKENKTIHQTNSIGNHEEGFDRYQFEDTFDESSTTCEVYNGVCKSIVNDVLNGYDGTIFAYGQTASGTFSLFFCLQILCISCAHFYTHHLSSFYPI